MPADALPEWPRGTAAVLVTAGRPPHAIPVSTAVRGGDDRVLFALGGRRDSLRRLKAEPSAALCLMAKDLALTIEGEVRVVADPLPDAGHTVGLELRVTAVLDHLLPGTAVDAPVVWRWTDDDASARDEAVHRGLAALAEGPAPE